ncbi:MAG: hypothetical protein H6587_03575 [Flavobacteriales bacterium]|nr:hypothetical protein [Flavobacteriales bacterium]MCB9363629.1 hypothetical protein [Flavobacteriales bacterium]
MNQHTYKADKKIINITCPSCKEKNHKWNDVYFDNGLLLKKAEKQYIAWCTTHKKYVVSSTL